MLKVIPKSLIGYLFFLCELLPCFIIFVLQYLCGLLSARHSDSLSMSSVQSVVSYVYLTPFSLWERLRNLPSPSQTGYRSTLIEDPLETLKHNERSGTWLWQGREDNVPVNDGWDPPQPKPLKEANNFSFRISINDSCFNWTKFPDAFDFIKDNILRDCDEKTNKKRI